MIDWSLCIATLNRHDVLMVALRHVLRQTRLPAQIVVVDSSDNWQDGRDRARELLAAAPDIRLDYTGSPVRSSATQRNLGIEMCTSEIVFLTDDDSFLHDTCAEAIMAVYEADKDGEVAGVGATLVDENPAVASGESGPERKQTGVVSLAGLSRAVLSTGAGRWINREILYQSSEMLFLRYDGSRMRDVPEAVAHLDVESVPFMPGSGMSFRRELGLREPFDSVLRYYAAFEDLDVGYRLAQHGAILRAGGAQLHHFEAAAGRIKRRKVITFQLLNMALFLKRNADRPDDFQGRYRVMLWRRLLAEVLKDGLSRRWRFPQAAGVLTAMRYWREVWRRSPAELDDWYPELQKNILDEIG